MTGLSSGGEIEKWPDVRLGDRLRLQNGYAFKSTDWTSTGRPIIRIQNLNSGTAGYHYYDKELPKRFLAHSGDLLFAWSGTPGTSFGAHIWHGDEAWINQHIFRVEFDPDDFDRNFLRYAINANLAGYVANAQGGVGLAHITKEKLNDSTLLCPALGDQQAVAQLLERVDRLGHRASVHLAGARRSLLRSQVAVLDAACSGRLTEDWRVNQSAGLAAPDTSTIIERRKSRDARGFVAPEASLNDTGGMLPEGWTSAQLGLLLEGIKYGTSHRCTPDPVGVPVLRIPNVSGNRLDVGDLKFAPLPDKESNDLALLATDLLMIRSNGSPHLVGKAVKVTREAIGMAFAGYLMRLRPDLELVLPNF